MRRFNAIFKRELLAMFMSPVGYVTMAVYMSATAWTLLQSVKARTGEEASLEALVSVSLMLWLPVLVTVVCMRLFAEEKRSGTLETLLTVAVGEWSVVLAKYCGALMFVVLTLVLSGSVVFVVAEMSPGLGALDLAAMFGGGLILLLVAAACTSIGVLVSLLTRNQIVAAISCFWAICMPFMLKPLLGTIPLLRYETLNTFSIEEHVLAYAGGRLLLSPAVFYLSLTLWMLYAAVRILESRRWL